MFIVVKIKYNIVRRKVIGIASACTSYDHLIVWLVGYEMLCAVCPVDQHEGNSTKEKNQEIVVKTKKSNNSDINNNTVMEERKL